MAEALLLVWRLERRLRSASPQVWTEQRSRWRSLPTQPVTRVSLPAPEALNDLIALAYRLCGLRPTCLRRSLLLKELLWRRAEPSRLVIGVARNGDWLESHAWVETGGSWPPRPLSDDAPFQSLVVF